jgi:antirestriction protein ArdC
MATARQTDAERERRRAEDRKRLEEAVRELQRSDGWQRWVAVRRHNGLGRYSVNNQLLIAIACWRREIEPTFVAGFRWWSEHGYQVRKGEKALRILGPVRRRIEDEATGEKRLVVVGFKRVSVFERAQVEAGPDAVPLEPESEPIGGDSHEAHLAPIAEALEAEGIRVDFGAIELGGARGYFDRKQRLIRVEHELGPNARLRVLLHEGAHALVAAAADFEDATKLSYAEEECVVETAGHVAAASLGLDTSGESVPYVASWGESGALEAVERAAALVDRIAGWLEGAAGAVDGDRHVLAEVT